MEFLIKYKKLFWPLFLATAFLLSCATWLICTNKQADAHFGDTLSHVTNNVNYDDVFCNREGTLNLFSDVSPDVNMADITPDVNSSGGCWYFILFDMIKSKVVGRLTVYELNPNTKNNIFDHFTYVYTCKSTGNPVSYYKDVAPYYGNFYGNPFTYNQGLSNFSNIYACYADKVSCGVNDTSCGSVDNQEGWLYEYQSSATGDINNPITLDPNNLKASYKLSLCQSNSSSYAATLENDDKLWNQDNQPKYKNFTVVASPKSSNNAFLGFDYYINGTKKGTIKDLNTSIEIKEQGAIKLVANFTDKPFPIVNPPKVNSGLVYNGQSQRLCLQGSTSLGTLQYALSDSDEVPPLESAWSANIPTGNSVGNYFVWYRVPEDKTTLGLQAQCAGGLTISKVNPTVYPYPTPIIDIVYNGQPQNLCNWAGVDFGTLYYAISADSSTPPIMGWSESVPQGVYVGDYYVWYKVVGDSNVNDLSPAFACVSSIHMSADNFLSYSPFNGLYTGEYHDTGSDPSLDNNSVSKDESHESHDPNILYAYDSSPVTKDLVSLFLSLCILCAFIVSQILIIVLDRRRNKNPRYF